MGYEFINIRIIVEYLGNDVAAKLHQIHTVTGCNTTYMFFLTYSFLHVAGKIKVIKKCLNEKEKLRRLNTIGVSCKVSNTAVKDVKVLKSLLKLFPTLEKKKKVLLK